MSTPPTARSETHTATTEGLLPCPFCGGSGWCSSNRDKPPKKYNGYHGIVRCMACSACTTELGGETLDAALERAKERWNRRAGMAEPQAVAEVLEACEALLLELHLLRSCDTVRVSKNSAFITNIRRAVAKARGIAPGGEGGTVTAEAQEKPQ